MVSNISQRLRPLALLLLLGNVQQKEITDSCLIKIATSVVIDSDLLRYYLKSQIIS